MESPGLSSSLRRLSTDCSRTCRKIRSSGSMQPIRFPCAEFKWKASVACYLQGWQAHTSFTGGKILKSFRRGMERSFHFSFPTHDPDLPKYFISLQHLLTRKFQPLKRITIETINEERATESPYIPSLRTSFDISVDPKEVVLFRKAK